MSKVPYGKYSKELREEAVRLMTEENLTAGSASKTLDIPKSTLESWLRLHKQGKLSSVGKGKKPLTEVEQELARVKRRLSIKLSPRVNLGLSGHFSCTGP
jgi:transposase